MASLQPPKAFDALVLQVEEHAAWQGGLGSEFKCDALVGAQFLTDLVYLASHAPADLLTMFAAGDALVVIGEG